MLDTQGHRGARGLLPENTLPAFARAIEIGVTTLELDCGMTKDGVVVVSHDTALNPDITREANGRWLESRGPLIHELTYAQLERYDVGRIRPGSDYARRFPIQQPVDGARIPRLADVFALAGPADVRFNLETKLSPSRPEETASPETFVAALLAEIDAASMVDRMTIQSFYWRMLDVVRASESRIKTAALTAEQDWTDNIARAAPASAWTEPHHVSAYAGSIPRTAQAAGAAVWSPYFTEISVALVREAHALGMAVVVWTVNEESDMRRMIDYGVDAILSDYPDVLCRVAGATPRDR